MSDKTDVMATLKNLIGQVRQAHEYLGVSTSQSMQDALTDAESALRLLSAPVDAARAAAWIDAEELRQLTRRSPIHVYLTSRQTNDDVVPLYTTPPNTVPVAKLEALISDCVHSYSSVGTVIGALRALITKHKVTP